LLKGQGALGQRCCLDLILIRDVQIRFETWLPYGVDYMDPYTSVLVGMGRGPEVPVVTTQEELEERLTAVVLQRKEERERVFHTRKDAE